MRWTSQYFFLDCYGVTGEVTPQCQWSNLAGCGWHWPWPVPNTTNVRVLCIFLRKISYVFFGFVSVILFCFVLSFFAGGGCFLFWFGLVWLFVCLFVVNMKNRNIPWLHKDNPGLLFTKRWDVLPSNLVTSRSHQIGCYNDRIPLKFDRALPRCLPNCRAIRKI